MALVSLMQSQANTPPPISQSKNAQANPDTPPPSSPGQTRTRLEPLGKITRPKIPENIPLQAKQKQNKISFHRERLDPDRVHHLATCIG
jgi:hypothetical protein